MSFDTKVSLSLDDLMNNTPMEDLTPDPMVREIYPLMKIKITKHALEKMFFLANNVCEYFDHPYEVYAYCLGKDQVVHDILIPYQTVSSASVKVDSQDVLRLRPEIEASEYDILGWTHSHADFGVFFSGTDRQNQTIIFNDTMNYFEIEGSRCKYSIGMTVNIHGRMFGVITTQFPSGKKINVEAAFEIIEDNLDYDVIAMDDEIMGEICQKIKVHHITDQKIYRKL